MQFVENVPQFLLKNLPDVVFSPGFTMFIDIAHLGLMMCYLFAALIFVIFKSKWTRGLRIEQ